MRDESSLLFGRQTVLSAFKGEVTIERIFILKGSDDSTVNTIIKKSKSRGIRPEFVDKSRLDEMTREGNHQGVCAFISEYSYCEVEDILALARERDEDPFIVLLDGIEDPQNLGAIIRSSYLLGAHGVIIPKRGSATLTGSAAKASAGAVAHTLVARVVNIKNTMESLKDAGLWFVCADLNGKSMYDLNLTGPIGLVIGGEGGGVSRLVKEHCDYTATVPMVKRDDGIDSYNASVAMGIIGAEIFRQREIR